MSHHQDLFNEKYFFIHFSSFFFDFEYIKEILRKERTNIKEIFCVHEQTLNSIHIKTFQKSHQKRSKMQFLVIKETERKLLLLNQSGFLLEHKFDYE